jgi:hypothetical protein
MLHVFKMVSNMILLGTIPVIITTSSLMKANPYIFSNDILKRWTFPIVPETNLQESDAYDYSRGNIYKGSRVMLSK